ncbi:hypothetical protein SAMN02745751_03403 [Dethiosulfatibacter aminovorans DSM 17477]|uniref:Uncharacterized protein n=1 Tax=Dethiosulfatibacter aminovorans DSM 17477 TaxID=1121476 RepID=A0A1M6M937_9FIRM|nr:hypothetical protein [Dethiosulfatibacter aminovorans]SHJ79978.1 hypothetical protein SAMN02745751_03403 [Dethiosulfatibacter aminovorans DSM 17477]
MSYLNEIIIASISALVGGIITYFFYLKKESRREKKEKLLKKEEQRKKRPEFRIESMKDSFNRPGTCIDSQPCDMEIFVAKIENVIVENDIVYAEYDDTILDKKSWVSRQYTIKNIGKTAVYEVAIMSNFKRTTCLFNTKSIHEDFIQRGVLNYFELLDRRIDTDESITLKICYNKEKVIKGMFSAEFELGMRDDNGVYWVQPFFAYENKIYESRRITHKEYRDAIKPDIAIECFKKPYLW